MTFDAMNGKSNIWDNIQEEIEDYNCICSGISPLGRRSLDAE